MNTLQVYKVLADAAGAFNRLAVRLREGEITKTEAQEKAKEKAGELSNKLA